MIGRLEAPIRTSLEGRATPVEKDLRLRAVRRRVTAACSWSSRQLGRLAALLCLGRIATINPGHAQPAVLR